MDFSPRINSVDDDSRFLLDFFQKGKKFLIFHIALNSSRHLSNTNWIFRDVHRWIFREFSLNLIVVISLVSWRIFNSKNTYNKHNPRERSLSEISLILDLFPNFSIFLPVFKSIAQLWNQKFENSIHDYVIMIVLNHISLQTLHIHTTY